MNVLVAYATHHGATREIAERVAHVLGQSGLTATVQRADQVRDVHTYDAVVVGSALYCGWLKEAAELIRRNRATLLGKRVWLFSSGPLGTDRVDASGRDVLATAVPKDIVELGDAVHARDHRVFFGAYDPAAKAVGFLERSFKLLPKSGSILQSGDFRDWGEIESWARSIADELNLEPPAAAPREPAAARAATAER